MSAQDIPTLWKKAIDKYEHDTNLKLSGNFVHLTTHANLTAEAILNEVEIRQTEFKAFRSKNERLRNALEPFSFIVKSMAGAIGHGSKLAFPPAEAICSATVVLLKAADGVSANYDAITEMLESLSDFLDRLKLYVDIGVNVLIEKIIVQNLAQILVVLGLATNAIKEQRTIAYFKELVGKNSKVQKAMKKLAKLATREENAVASTTFAATHKILQQLETRMKVETDNDATVNQMLIELSRGLESVTDKSQESQALLEDIRNSLSDISKHHLSQTERDIQEWLGAPDASSNHYEARRKRTPGTGAWLLQDSLYSDWKRGKENHPILWLSGRPGCGKSILSSTIIEDVNFEAKADPSVCLAYFYFSFRDADKQTCRGLLLSLVDQLSSMSSGMPSCVERFYTQRRSRKSQPSWEELLVILQEICAKRDSNVYRVIDALDECIRDEWFDLIEILKSIQSWELTHLRIICTSRREEPLAGLLSPISHEMNLENSLVDPDIARYVDTMLAEDPRFDRWRNRSREIDEIKKTLAQRANGMFRWAFCQLESLSKCISRKDLLKTLQNLPRTLHDTYERILSRIDDEHFQYAFSVLQWLCFSYEYEPLKLERIAEVLAIEWDEEPPRFDEDDRLPNPRDILTICASLVSCTKEGYLELAHFSVKEYLLSEISGPAKRYAVDARLAHSFIAKSCLVYLLQFTEPISEETSKLHPLATYAAKYWADHYRDGDFCVPTDTVLSLLCSTAEQYVNMIRLYPMSEREPFDDVDVEASFWDQYCPHALYYAAFFGLRPVVQSLLPTDADVNDRNRKFGTALQAASYGGHDSTVSLLLDNGADVNILSGLFGQALRAACFQGHESTVKLLLASGAEVNAHVPHSEGLLQMALKEGQKAVARYLSKTFDTEVWTYWCFVVHSMLQAACVNESKAKTAVMQSLLQNGADVNFQGGCFDTALQAVSAAGQVDVVQFLLSNGADVNTRGGYYGTSLHAASYSGNEEIVKLLLASGAEVNVICGRYGTALQAACARHSNTPLIQLLLDSGADVNIRGGKYNTALQAASRKSIHDDSVVQLLLDNGADVNTQGGKYQTALQAGSRSGGILTVKLLLFKGADVTVLGGKYGTALHAACRSYNCLKKVRLLLENGADVNARGGKYETSLQAASSKGWDFTVKLLLERGADVTVQGGKYGSALQAAIQKGNDSTVQMLEDSLAGRQPEVYRDEDTESSIL